MFGIFNRRPQRCPLVYVVAGRREFLEWVRLQPTGVRYQNIHNEAGALGLVHVSPPPKFIVLRTADYRTLLYLHRHGFPVEAPKPQESARERDVREWKEKLDSRYQEQLAGPPEQDMRERIRKWHWSQHFKYAAEGNKEKAAYHRNLARSVEAKTKGQLNMRQIAMKQKEEDRQLLELLDQVPCAEQKS